jgi:hypothetical protein
MFKYATHIQEEEEEEAEDDVSSFRYSNKQPLHYLIDKTLGVEFTVNLNTGMCRIKAMPDYSPPLNPDQPFDAGLDFISKFIATGSLIPRNVKFTFNGEKKSNGIKSDRFIGNVSSSIYEYTFSSVYTF